MKKTSVNNILKFRTPSLLRRLAEQEHATIMQAALSNNVSSRNNILSVTTATATSDLETPHHHSNFDVVTPRKQTDTPPEHHREKIRRNLKKAGLSVPHINRKKLEHQHSPSFSHHRGEDYASTAKLQSVRTVTDFGDEEVSEWANE